MFSKLLVVVGALAALNTVSAQSASSSAAGALPTANLPQCAITCAISASQASGCAVTDFQCLCTNQSYQASFYQCQQSSCSPSELQSALQFGQQQCAAAGFPINTAAVPSGVSSSAASSGSGSSSASRATSTGASSSAASSSAARSTTPAASAASSGASAAATSARPNGASQLSKAGAAVALVGAAIVAAL